MSTRCSTLRQRILTNESTCDLFSPIGASRIIVGGTLGYLRGSLRETNEISHENNKHLEKGLNLLEVDADTYNSLESFLHWFDTYPELSYRVDSLDIVEQPYIDCQRFERRRLSRDTRTVKADQYHVPSTQSHSQWSQSPYRR